MVSASQTVFSRTVVNIQEDKKKDGRCIDFCHFEDLNYGSNHRFNYRSKKKIWFCLKKSVTNLTDVAQRPAVLTWFLLSQISQNNTTASAVINHNKPLCVPSWKLNKCCAPGKIVYYYLWMGLLLFGVSNNPQKKKKMTGRWSYLFDLRFFFLLIQNHCNPAEEYTLVPSCSSLTYHNKLLCDSVSASSHPDLCDLRYHRYSLSFKSPGWVELK